MATIEVDKQIPAWDCDAHQYDDGRLYAWGDIVVDVISEFGGGNSKYGGLVFTSVNIPQGATITAAKIDVCLLHPVEGVADDAHLYIYGEDVDSAVVFDAEHDVVDRPTTTEYTVWNEVDLGTRADEDGWVDSPDFTDVIQEIVDRPEWAANNNICILLYGLNSFVQKTLSFWSCYGDTTLAAKLHIEYEGGVTHEGAAVLTGSGSLSGVGHGIFIGKSTLSGVGTLAAIGSFLRYGQATLTGTGSLSAKAVLIAIGKATLTGAGTLTAIGQRIVHGVATLTGVGVLTAIGSFLRYGKVALSGIGNLSAIATRYLAPGVVIEATLEATRKYAAKLRARR